MSDSIDLLIPTYNRSDLLAECLESVIRAGNPADLDWRAIVIDNNSTDNTAEVARSFERRCPARVQYVFEGRQGKSAALNRGISTGTRALIGMIDDDEQIDSQWFRIAAESFADPAVDYIGGPYLPLWRAERPDWLPDGRQGVLGADDPASLPPSPVPFEGHDYFLRGGNAVIRRSVIERVGLYSTTLGPVGSDHGSCEDHEMFGRLQADGARGLYVPRLIIYHVIPPGRVSRKYFRYWTFRHAQSLAVLERTHRQNVPYVGPVPRYLIGSALRDLRGWRRKDEARKFAAELKWWDIAGYVYGAYRRSGRDAG